MSHAADVAQGHRTRLGHEGRMDKGVAHVPPGGGIRSLRVFGELLTHKVPSHETGGAYALFEAATDPGSAGPPPHVNHREDESFYVLEGEYEFLSGGGILRTVAGSLVYVPRGTLHAHRNVGDGVGRMLVVQTPGGLYERFFEEVGKPADGDDAGPLVFGDRRVLTSVAATAANYGIEM
jgi:mannose-6-phosphate isomerase-like protein (cupin superfamily)